MYINALRLSVASCYLKIRLLLQWTQNTINCNSSQLFFFLFFFSSYLTLFLRFDTFTLGLCGVELDSILLLYNYTGLNFIILFLLAWCWVLEISWKKIWPSIYVRFEKINFDCNYFKQSKLQEYIWKWNKCALF
jgi:hypothetical protein